MSNIINIILQADRENIKPEDLWVVRETASSQKELLTLKMGDNVDLIEVAKQKGIARFEVAIAKNTGYSKFYSQEELNNLMVRYFSELSEEYYYAQWDGAAEFEFWELINIEYEELIKIKFWKKRLQREDVDDLKWLAKVTNSWATWDDERNDVIIVPVDKWIRIYDEWVKIYKNFEERMKGL